MDLAPGADACVSVTNKHGWPVNRTLSLFVRLSQHQRGEAPARVCIATPSAPQPSSVALCQVLSPDVPEAAVLGGSSRPGRGQRADSAVLPTAAFDTATFGTKGTRGAGAGGEEGGAHAGGEVVEVLVLVALAPLQSQQICLSASSADASCTMLCPRSKVETVPADAVELLTSSHRLSINAQGQSTLTVHRVARNQGSPPQVPVCVCVCMCVRVCACASARACVCLCVSAERRRMWEMETDFERWKDKGFSPCSLLDLGL